VTTPRIDTRYVVTEFGAVNLKGLSSTERVHAHWWASLIRISAMN
jgi:acyl-CoA hydrolase